MTWEEYKKKKAGKQTELSGINETGASESDAGNASNAGAWEKYKARKAERAAAEAEANGKEYLQKKWDDNIAEAKSAELEANKQYNYASAPDNVTGKLYKMFHSDNKTDLSREEAAKKYGETKSIVDFYEEYPTYEGYLKKVALRDKTVALEKEYTEEAGRAAWDEIKQNYEDLPVYFNGKKYYDNGKSEAAGLDIADFAKWKQTAPSDSWSDDEKYRYAYFKKNGGDWEEYARELNRGYASASREKEKEEREEFAKTPIGGVLTTAESVLLGGIEGLGDYLNQLIYPGMKEYSDHLSMFDSNQVGVSAIAEDLNKNGGTIDKSVPLFGGRGWGDAYQLVNSILQSALIGYATAGAGNVGKALTFINFFGQASAGGINEAKAKGATDGEALAYGTLAGVFEGLFEELSLDKVIKLNNSPAGLKELISNVLKSAGIEASEEMATTTANKIADAVILGERSDLSNETLLKNIEDILWDGVAGAISGGVHSGGMMTANYVWSNSNAERTERAMLEDFGKNIGLDESGVSALVDGYVRGNDVSEYAEEFMKYYDAGRQGTEIPSGEGIMSENLRKIAYNEGKIKAIEEEGQAGQNESRLSIKKSADGQIYVDIDTDQNIFDGANVDEYAKIAKRYIQNRFQGKSVGDVSINGRSASEYTRSKSSNYLYAADTPMFETKMRGATELDNFIKSGRLIRHESAEHIHDYNKNGYDRYNVRFSIDGNMFSGELLVAINENGNKNFYDIVKIKRSTSNPSRGVSGKITSASTDIISESGKKVNKNAKKHAANIGYAFGENTRAVYESGNASSADYSAAFAEAYKNGYLGRGVGTSFDDVRSKFGADIISDAQLDDAYQAGADDRSSQRGRVTRGSGKVELNGAKVTSEERDMLRELAAFGQVDIKFDDLEGANGTYKDGVIYIDKHAEHPVAVVLGHEGYHRFREAAPAQAQIIERIAYEAAEKKDPDIAEKTIARYAEAGQTITYADAIEEIAAEYIGDVVNTPENFRQIIKQASTQRQKNAVARLFDKIRELWNRVKAKFTGAKYEKTVSDADKAIAALEKMMYSAKIGIETEAETASEGGEKASIKKTMNMPYVKQLELIEKNELNGSNSLYVGTPGQNMQNAGLSSAPFAMNQSDYRKSRRKGGNNEHYSSHNVSLDFFEKIQENLNSAPIIIDNGERLSVITDYAMNDKNGKASFVMVGIMKNQQMENDIVNQIKSVYPLDDIFDKMTSYAKSGKIVVLNKNKAEKLLTTIGLQLSEVSNILDSAKTIISQKDEKSTGKMSLKEKDSEYLKAVEDGDMTTAQRMVDEAAREAGYNSPKLYHGTEKFGFTKFDLEKMDDKRTIFLTNSKELASTYSGAASERAISEKATVPENLDPIILASELNQSLPADEAEYGYSYTSFSEKSYKNLVKRNAVELIKLKEFFRERPIDKAKKFSATIEQLVAELNQPYDAGNDNLSTPIYILLHHSDVFDGYTEVKMSDLESNIRLAQQLSAFYSKENDAVAEKGAIAKVGMEGYDVEVLSYDDARKVLEKNSGRGNYGLYAKLDNTLEIDGRGRNWNKLGYRPNGSNDILNTTREISKWAQESGYDGVIIRNISDNGGRNITVELQEKADVYMLFDPNRIKSADPVTYDDDGNVIPLSERFNTENKDIRYSLKKSDAEKRVAELAEELERVRQSWSENGEFTGSLLPSETQLKKTVDILMDGYAGEKTKKALTAELNELFGDIRKYRDAKTTGYKDKLWEAISPKLDKIAADLCNGRVSAEKDESGLYLYNENMPRAVLAQKLELMYSLFEMPNFVRDDMKAGTDVNKLYEKIKELRTEKEAALEKVREQRRKTVKALKLAETTDAEIDQKYYESEARKKLLRIAKRMSGIKYVNREYTIDGEKVNVGKLIDRAVHEAVESLSSIKELDVVSLGMRASTREYLENLSDWYADQKRNNSDFYGDERTEAELARLSKIEIAQMSIRDVEALTDALLNVENTIRTQNKLIDSADKRSFQEQGGVVINDVEHLSGVNNGLWDKIVTESLSPLRAIARITGYNESDPLMMRTRELNDGQRNMLSWIVKYKTTFNEYTSDTEYMKKLTGKNADVVMRSGDGIMTRGMLMSLYLHSTNAQNMKHVERGGAVLPNGELYKAGKIRDAYDKKTIVKMSRSQIVKLANENLSERDFAFAAAVKRYFNVDAKAGINEVSNKLLGYDLAKVGEYFPISVDGAFTKAEYEQVKCDGSVAGMGNLKERVDSALPIELIDITSVLNQAINLNAKYIGLAIPVRNISKLLRITKVQSGTDSVGNIVLEKILSGDGFEHYIYDTSVMDAIEKKWGSNAADYIKKLLADVQGLNVKERSTFTDLFDGLRSNYAQAVLTLNPSVALKQTASYPTAAAVIGWKALMKGLTSKRYVNIDVVAKYTPLLAYRSLGYTDADLGTIVKRKGRLPKGLNWIQTMDVLTTKRLWAACEFYVEENKPNLERTTDAYYKAVAEVYNRVIEETQPNYTVMQRPQMLRTNDTLLKNLAMFKTQPMQNLNLIFDAVGNLRAKNSMYTQNPTAENKAALEAAKKTLGRVISSQIAQAVMMAAITFGWSALRGRLGRYKDDDDELGGWMIARMMIDMAENLVSGVPGATEVTAFFEAMASSIVKGKYSYYGIEAATPAMLTDLADAYLSFQAKMTKVLSGNGDAGKAISAAETLATQIGNAIGIPIGNVDNIIRIILGWFGVK